MSISIINFLLKLKFLNVQFFILSGNRYFFNSLLTHLRDYHSFVVYDNFLQIWTCGIIANKTTIHQNQNEVDFNSFIQHWEKKGIEYIVGYEKTWHKLCETIQLKMV